MKKYLLTFLGLAVMLPMSVSAGNNGGGFVGGDNSREIVTVTALEDMQDDAYVILQGTITGKIGSETYTFKDNTGTIQIEIDDDDWNGLTVRPEDVVIIEGELDKNWTGPDEIDVDVIRLAQ